MTPRLLCALLASLALVGCGATPFPETPLPDTETTPVDPDRHRLVARVAHITDAHITDEESPGRLSALARANASAWRPHERYAIHQLDGTLRAINAYHARVAPIDLVVHTGDGADNAQLNELHWLLDCFDGRIVNPLSGDDDRTPTQRDARLLDAHAPFETEGLYRQGVHGDLPSIPWYTTVGNHDRYAVGIFPIVRRWDGRLHAPLPVGFRIGLFLPTALAPDGAIGYGLITPANPGPPPEVSFASWIAPNPDRRFVTMSDWVAAHHDTLTGPPGHGIPSAQQTWYSVAPVDGLRLIALDTTIPIATIPTAVYEAGAVLANQARFLETELQRAQDRDEVVIVLTHHPSVSLAPALGSALSPQGWRDLLNQYPNVVAHLAGHTHRQRVWDRGRYLEFETSAIIDAPQQGRILEVWRSDEDVVLRYTVFSHLYDGTAFETAGLDPPPADPWLPMRQTAADLARDHAHSFDLKSTGEWWVHGDPASAAPAPR